ncbi:MAG: PspC domain-containing protein [Nocardioidaceae bacterium]
MTQTPGPSSTDEQTRPPDGPPPDDDRPHLPRLEQLRRSTTDRRIAGVAGGLGRHLNVDPTVLRVVLVVLCFFGGAGFLLYGAAWVLVPEDGRTQGALKMGPSARSAVLVGAAVLALLLLLGNSWGGIGVPWPVLIVGTGALVYLALRDRGTRPASAPGAGQPFGTQPYATQPPWLPPPTDVPVPPAPRRRTGPLLFGYTVALVAVALGLLGLYDASGGHVVDAAYPALALTVVGAMLVLGAFVGRAGGLVLLGILASLALAVTSVVGSVGLGADGGRLTARPVSADAVQDSYFVPSGRVTVDLSRVADPQDLVGRTIDIGARAGEVVVVLPRGVGTHIQADISGPGQIDLPHHVAGGFDISTSEGQGGAGGTVDLITHLFAGHIDVRTP